MATGLRKFLTPPVRKQAREDLDPGWRPITDAGVIKLAGLKNLLGVGVKKMAVTDAGVPEFEKRNPNTAVFR